MKRIKPVYNFIAVNLLSTLLLLVTLNLLLGLLFFIKDTYGKRGAASPPRLFNEDGSPTDNGKRIPYQLEWFDYNATREVTESEAADVIDDFYDLHLKGFAYQPWAQFSEPPFEGKRVRVDVDEKGFPLRRTLNPQTDKAKPVINIFILGGSTSFGYYVADEHTWPSYLSSILNERARAEGLDVQIQVTNYGRAGYYPSLETALGIDLLRNGHRPQLVILMDGINTGPDEDVPDYTRELERAFYYLQHEDRKAATRGMKQILNRWVPMMRLAASINSRLRPRPQPPAESRQASPDNPLTPDEVAQVQHTLQRFKQNRNILKNVCDAYGAETLFFLQPDPIYNYPAGLYRRRLPAEWWLRKKQKQLFYEGISKEEGFVSLTQLFETFGVGAGRKAILDDVHYSPSFNRFLAETVASFIELKRLKPASSADTAVPTGAKWQATWRF